MKWQFNITDASKNSTYKAEMVWKTYQIEEIKVTGDGADILLQNNRPLLEAIELHVPIKWRVIQGSAKEALLPKIQKELEKQLCQPATKVDSNGKKSTKAK